MNILWPVAEWMPEFKGLNLCVSPSSERLVLPSQDVGMGVTSLGRQTSYPLFRFVLGPSVRNGLHTENYTALSFRQSSGDTVWEYFYLLLNRQLYYTVTDLCVCASPSPEFFPLFLKYYFLSSQHTTPNFCSSPQSSEASVSDSLIHSFIASRAHLPRQTSERLLLVDQQHELCLEAC